MMLLMREKERERKRETYFISTLLIYILDYTYITFSYENVLFLNILFRYNTLLTQEKNIVNKWHYFQGVSWA